ncbi:hypothetical protein CEXT_484301 [Caerostris extrusa]|uniref:Uncharacterized protein n=1 Tax=Caerostris extrusa TaxID=172846 RepID=A0AAV4Y513_CAEEX|nr:hypothetical protein CEXT_484301 [Caerostris extrusa]
MPPFLSPARHVPCQKNIDPSSLTFPLPLRKVDSVLAIAAGESLLRAFILQNVGEHSKSAIQAIISLRPADWQKN